MFKKTVLLFAAVCLIVSLLPAAAALTSGGAEASAILPEDYSNQVSPFVPDVHGSRGTSFVDALPSGGYQAVYYHSGVLYIVNYDDAWNVLESKTLDLELPLWGGVFQGEQYNYVVCGQRQNEEAADGGEVIRVIKYDKDFQRLGSVSFTADDTYTYVPFDAGNVSLAECGNILTLYTSRLMPNGHQSNLELHINTDDMTIHDRVMTDEAPGTYVSHSFRQIVKYDGDLPVYVDLADAYPVRSVYIQFGPNQIPLMLIDGETGNNTTNTEVSGLGISDSYYFVVGSYLNLEENNIFCARIDKEGTQIQFSWLTAATCFNSEYVSYPKITKVSEDCFVIMWNQDLRDSVQYVLMDQTGNLISEVKEVSGIHLTDCEPIYADGRIQWLSVKEGVASVQQITDLSATGTFEWEHGLVEAVSPWDGTTDTSWYQDERDHFTITTPQQLAGLSELAAAGNTFAGKTVSLANDLFMNELTFDHLWTPIAYWEGTFHGNGHTIYNLSRQDSQVLGGLFHTIGPEGSVKALDLVQGVFHSGGAVAHINEGMISFCNNYSLVYGLEYANSGSICNINKNLVYGCKNYGNVFGYDIAGVVGENENTLAVVNQCSNHGFVSGCYLVGGVLGFNRGWIYNCYSRGVACRFIPGDPNEARAAYGIVSDLDASMTNHDVESCYHAGTILYRSGDYSDGFTAVAPSAMLNCYALSDQSSVSNDLSYMTREQMTDPGFVELLNRQTNTMFPAWVEDTEGINDGFPITVAEANAQQGIYKIQPELWLDWQGTVTLHEGRSQSSYCGRFYNESELEISVADPSIMDYSLSGSTVYFTPKNIGETRVLFHFDETDNTCAADYTLTVEVVPHIWSEWTVTEAPSDTSDGVESRYCTVCMEEESRSMADPNNPFVDVKKGKFYYESVMWAVENDITQGKTATTFAPGEECTRAQVVTFLWRAAGMPEPTVTEHPFTDVKEGAYYYKAMLWAVEKGITNGTDATHFSPSKPCDRGTVVTFLHRSVGKPAPTSTEHPFTDVVEGKFYYNAMLWAVENGITSGMTDTIFAPSRVCTRGQVVTFLYRAYADRIL